MTQNGAAPSDERWLVTGAFGCVGAWTVRALVREGARVIGYDRPGEPHRLRLVMTDDELERLTIVHGDITDLAHLRQTLEAHDIDRVVHLAALQVPTIRSDPPRGALVNVVGTVNVFEAVKARIAQGGRMGPVVYAGSVGMFDAGDADPVDGRLHVDAAAHPPTHYGVFKLANEGNARVYWRDDGIPSVGLRPMTVYGPGRDQGMTSGPTKAILAAVAGVPYCIPFGNRTLLQYAEDVAQALVAAGRSHLGGAQVLNLGGSLASMSELIAAIEAELPARSGSRHVRCPAAAVPGGSRHGRAGDPRRRGRDSAGRCGPPDHRDLPSPVWRPGGSTSRWAEWLRRRMQRRRSCRRERLDLMVAAMDNADSGNDTGHVSGPRRRRFQAAPRGQGRSPPRRRAPAFRPVFMTGATPALSRERRHQR